MAEELARLFRFYPNASDAVTGEDDMSVTIDNKTIDVSSKDDPLWDRFLAGTGTATISASGKLVAADTGLNALRTAALAKSTLTWELKSFNGSNQYSGSGLITSFGESASNGDVIKWTVSVQVTGAVTYESA